MNIEVTQTITVDITSLDELHFLEDKITNDVIFLNKSSQKTKGIRLAFTLNR